MQYAKLLVEKRYPASWVFQYPPLTAGAIVPVSPATNIPQNGDGPIIRYWIDTPVLRDDPYGIGLCDGEFVLMTRMSLEDFLGEYTSDEIRDALAADTKASENWQAALEALAEAQDALVKAEKLLKVAVLPIAEQENVVIDGIDLLGK